MCFLDKKKQLPGDEFDISVWKPLDTKGKPINQDEPLIYNHYSGKAYYNSFSIPGDCPWAIGPGLPDDDTGLNNWDLYKCFLQISG